MKIFIFGLLILTCGNAMACQYGMDSSKRIDEVIKKEFPNATMVTWDGLQDTTFSPASIISPNDCPSDFRLSGQLEFINEGKICNGKIVLKYRENVFSSGKIRSVFCRKI